MGCVDVVQCLISAGANLENADDNGDTPLIHATTQHHLEVVKCLIAAGANPETKGSQGRTAEINAKAYGCQDIYEYLSSLHAK